MFDGVVIENFRGIEKLEVPLSPLTVLVGPNGVGKSSVLDALLFGGRSLGDGLVEAVHRRQGLSDPSSWLMRFGTSEARLRLRQGDEELAVELMRTAPWIHAKRSRGSRVDESLSVDFSSGRPSNFASRSDGTGLPVCVVDSTARFDAQEIAIRLTELTKSGHRGLVDDALRRVDSRAMGISIGADASGRAEPYVDLVGGGVPLSLAGDGIRFLAQLIVGLMRARGGTALLEEPETHLHPTGIRALADAIVSRVAEGDQVVLSTHSLELVDRLRGRFGRSGPSPGLMSVVRLYRDGSTLKTRVIEGDRISFVLDEMGEDLR